MYDNLSKVIDVDINEVLPNRFQPRIQFDEEEILELSDSIKEHGVIQPLVVRPIGDKYEIIAGERRYKASVLAGKETVPVIVRNLDDKDSAEIALIENVQRKNLTPIEEALSYKKILDMGYITQENLASKLGKSQPSVANKIRLLNLSDEVQEALLENKISERHARSLLKLSSSEQQNQMLSRIITERLTVRRTDEEIEKLKNSDNDESGDSQKIIEKGEINMNNDNMFGIPNVSQNTQPSFDIFGGSTPTPAPQPISANIDQPTPAPSFDIFSNNTQSANPAIQDFGIGSIQKSNVEQQTVQPYNQSMPVQPQPSDISMGFSPLNNIENTTNSFMPTQPVQSIENVNSMGNEFNLNDNTGANINPVTQDFGIGSISSASAESSQPFQSTSGIQFDSNGNVIPTFEQQNISNNSLNLQSTIPSQPEIAPIPNPLDPQQAVPETSPIIESPVGLNQQMTQQSENLFSFGNPAQEATVSEGPKVSENSSIPEFKMPEPIIVTDYSKQYDPVMPQAQQAITPKVDFKEVINAIRECSSKIEQFGYKIDVEEYDLSNLYQVVFKIEK